MTKAARLFVNGRSQAVRLPLELRFHGDRVRVSRQGNGVLLEPMAVGVDEWFQELDRFRGDPFMPGGRNQPEAPARPKLA